MNNFRKFTDSLIENSIETESEFKSIISCLDTQKSPKCNKQLPIGLSGLSDGASAAFCACLVNHVKSSYELPTLFVMPNEKDAMRLINRLSLFGYSSLFYPCRDLVFHNITTSHEYEHQRLLVLSKLSSVLQLLQLY